MKLLFLGLLVYGAYLLTLQATYAGIALDCASLLGWIQLCPFLVSLRHPFGLPFCRRLQGRHEPVD